MSSDEARAPWLGAFGRRLFGSLALLSLLMVAAVGLLGYTQARKAVMNEATLHMESVARERRARLEAWFEERLGDMRLLAGLVERERGAKQRPTGGVTRLLELQLERQAAYRHCLLFDMEGTILAEAGDPDCESCQKDHLPSLDETLSTGRSVLGPVFLDPGGRPVMHLSAPVHEGGERVGAVMAVMSPGATIHPILADSTGLGSTGETYLVGADTLMLTPSRHMNHPPELTHTMPTDGVHAALAGKDGAHVYRGYLGQEVLGAYQWLPRQRWALLAEIQTAEAFAPLKSIARQTVLLGLLALLVALLLGVTLSRRLSQPIGELAAASEKVAAGDLRPPVVHQGPGEIGRLARRFGGMVESLARSRRELEESSRQLVQAEKMAEVGSLAAGLVHEMRNPLAAVKMNLSGLARSEKLSATESEQLAIAREQAQRLERMLDELLDYSRPLELNPASLSLTELFEGVRRLSAQDLEARGIGLSCRVTPANLQMMVDGEVLTRALVNLVANAAQASPRNSVIQLTGSLADEHVVLEVIDRGQGMAPSVRERLFDPFFTTREDGIGLGMSNVRKFVELHGGELRIESEEGTGTVARVLLPPVFQRRKEGHA